MSTYPGGQPVRCVVAGCAIPGRHAPGCGDGCAAACRAALQRKDQP